LLSCPMPAGDATAGAPCCRLAATHQPTRRGRRYPSDVTDAQWALLDPLPDPAWLARSRQPSGETLQPSHRGRDRIRGGQRHQVASPACGLPALADGLQTVRPLGESRCHATDPGRAAGPCPAGGGPNGGAVGGGDRFAVGPCGPDRRTGHARVRRGKKVNGRTRNIVVDTVGFLLAVLVTPASIQDRVAARALLLRLRTTVGDRLRLVWADGGYTGTLLDWARRTLAVSWWW
jgi:hypothetical protein